MFLTNFHKADLPIYALAVLDPRVVKMNHQFRISDVATDIYDRKIPDWFSLHVAERGDLSDFWKIFNEIRKERNDMSTKGNHVPGVTEFVDEKIEKAMEKHHKECHEITITPPAWDYLTSMYALSSIKKAKPDPSKLVTVHTFDASAKMDTYHFYGKPDFERIERENIIEGGKVACLVEFGEIFKELDITRGLRIVKNTIPKIMSPGVGVCGWTADQYFMPSMSTGWWLLKERIAASIEEIKAEILKNKPKPEHYDGEKCELPVWDLSHKNGNGLCFEYTGEYRIKGVHNDEWGVFIDNSGSAVISFGKDRQGKPQWILRAIPVVTKEEIAKKVLHKVKLEEKVYSIFQEMQKELDKL